MRFRKGKCVEWWIVRRERGGERDFWESHTSEREARAVFARDFADDKTFEIVRAEITLVKE